MVTDYMLDTGKGFMIDLSIIEVNFYRNGAFVSSPVNNLRKKSYKTLTVEDRHNNTYNLYDVVIEDMGFCKVLKVADYEIDFDDMSEGTKEYIEGIPTI